MAILRFRIYWEDDDSVYRDIAIKHTQSFFDLHIAILKSFEFDSMHKATFTAATITGSVAGKFR
ncbi:MAG: hypothetical protein WDM90_22970 [Ferruginibacter sp.]